MASERVAVSVSPPFFVFGVNRKFADQITIFCFADNNVAILLICYVRVYHILNSDIFLLVLLIELAQFQHTHLVHIGLIGKRFVFLLRFACRITILCFLKICVVIPKRFCHLFNLTLPVIFRII